MTLPLMVLVILLSPMAIGLVAFVVWAYWYGWKEKNFTGAIMLTWLLALIATLIWVGSQ